MPRLSTTIASSGNVTQTQLRCLCRPCQRKKPERIMTPATQPPRKRYTGISQPQTWTLGSTSWFARVERISVMPSP
jgi:hypothetical protein